MNQDWAASPFRSDCVGLARDCSCERLGRDSRHTVARAFGNKLNYVVIREHGSHDDGVTLGCNVWLAEGLED